eukprot:gene14600-17262_t
MRIFAIFATFLVLASCASALQNLQDGIFNQTLALGEVKKGHLLTKTFTGIPLPAATFFLEAMQVNIVNTTGEGNFDHDAIVISSVDFTVGGKKIVSFTASNILTPLYFNSPYALSFTGAVDITVSLFTTNVEPHNVSLSYFMKWSTESGFVTLTRTATSCVANYSSFNLPGTGGQYTIQNSVVWQQNVDAMGFQAACSQGIVSLTLVSSTGAVICASTGVYKNNILQSMTECGTIVPLVKGTTYNTVAVYNNTKASKGVFGNFAFYVGFARPSTTGTHTTTGPATSSHTSSGPSSSGPSSSGPSSSGPSSSGPHSSSSGPSSSGPHSSSSGPHSSSGPSSSGPSSSGPASSSSGTTSSGSASGTTTSGSATSSQTSSQFDTTSSSPTGTSSDPTGSATSASPTVSPTGYTVSSGSGYVWEPTRKVQIY